MDGKYFSLATFLSCLIALAIIVYVVPMLWKPKPVATGSTTTATA